MSVAGLNGMIIAKAVVTYFKVLPQHLHGETEGSAGEPRSRLPVCRAKFIVITSRTRSRKANYDIILGEKRNLQYRVCVFRP